MRDQPGQKGLKMGNTQTLAVNPAENTRSYSVELFVRSLSPLGARTNKST